MKQESLERFTEEEIQGSYKLPEGWKWVRLGEISEIYYGKGLPKNERKDNGKFWAYGSNGPIYKTDQYIVEPPTLIAGRKGSIGAVHLVTERCWPIDTTYYINMKKQNIDIHFLYFYMKIVDFSKIAIITTKPGLNRDDLRVLPLPLPPIEEQKRIAARIEQLFNKIDEVKKLRKEALEEAKALLPSALHQIFSKAHEKGWKWVRLGDKIENDSKKHDLIIIESGKRPEGGSVAQGIPSLGGEQLLPNGKVNWNALRFIPEDFYESMKKGKIKEKDVLVVKDGATTGKTAYIDQLPYEKVAVNEHVFLLRSITNILDSKYLFYALFSDIEQNQIKKLFHGATQGGITQNDIRCLQIPLPPLEEQKRIVANLDKIQEKALALQKLQEETEKEIEKLREAILHKAFRGKL